MQENMMGHNIIITESSSNLRTLGRNALSGKWKLAILAYILYTVCLTVPTTIFDTFFGANINGAQYDYEKGMSVDMYSQLYNSVPEVSLISGLYTLLVTGAFTLGITIFFLALFRKQQVGVSDIFLGFERFGKALGLFVFQGVFITLWAMIGIAVVVLGIILMSFTVVGGAVIAGIGAIVAMVLAVIASLKYSQAFYIMADDPAKNIRTCVNESKIMMKGNKGKYLLLTLSFIGWMLISCIPMGVLSGLTEIMTLPDAAVIVLMVIASLFLVPVEVYTFSTMTGFYEILAGHLIKETEPAPVEPEAVPAVVEPVAAENVQETLEKKDGEKNEQR